jgi:hypothetical protein
MAAKMIQDRIEKKRDKPGRFSLRIPGGVIRHGSDRRRRQVAGCFSANPVQARQQR